MTVVGTIVVETTDCRASLRFARNDGGGDDGGNIILNNLKYNSVTFQKDRFREPGFRRVQCVWDARPMFRQEI